MAEAESARQYQRLEDAAQRRQTIGAELWRGVDLQTALDWKEKTIPTKVWAARYGQDYKAALDFLAASEDEERQKQLEAEQARQRELDQANELAEAQRARAGV